MPERESTHDFTILEVRSQLDAIKKVNPKNGIGYWMARDLMPKLGYETWENFRALVDRSIASCESSGINASQHFRETTKMINVGNGASRSVVDYFLSQHGAHLVAMNGDAQKPAIAAAQMYFSVQTLKQENAEKMTEEDRRIALRDRVKSNNKKLSAVAMDAGVSGKRMPAFHAAGYQGLYRRNKAEILAGKGLAPTEDLLDRSGSTELAANDFRITQAKDVLQRKGVVGEYAAIEVHRSVGTEVREAIAKIGGTMPENLPAQPSIKKIESERKRRAKITAKETPQIPASDDRGIE